MVRALGRVSAATVAALDCFILLGLLGIYLKFALINPHWTAIARFLGETAASNLSLTTRAGYFVQDVWLNLLAIPIVGTLVVTACFRRHRAVAAAILCATGSVAYFIELQVQKQVGQYLSRDVLRDLVGWTVSTAENAFEYVTAGSLVKFAGFLVLLVAFVILERMATRRSGTERHTRAWRRALWIPVLTAGVLVLATIPLRLFLPMPLSPFNTSAVGRAATMLTQSSGVDPSGGDMHTVVQAFRQLTASEPFDQSHAYVGRERESDAIIFMMETGAARALDLAVSGRDLPGTGPLYSRAFVASRHYTTHPYSSDALYSLFSGLYPHGRRRVLRNAPRGSINGLMTNLGPDVPIRRVYVPSLYQIELDGLMYEALGAESVYAADEHADDPRRRVAERRADEFLSALERDGRVFERRSRNRLRERLRADFQTLETVKDDIADAIRGNRRYMVMFFPEIGHGPWVPLRGERTVVERGRALMLLQDSWLKEILDLVRSLGRLERTVVAVTSDHGVRTRAEDPSLPVGELSDYTFRVPFLVYAPQTLSAPVRIDVPTSHIDLAPTLLALLGQTRQLGDMQGLPVWQRSAHHRLYLLAFAYGGADGFVENGRYYMRQGLSGATYVSDRLDFEDGHQVANADPIAGFVENELKRLEALQQALVAHVIQMIRSCPSGNCLSTTHHQPQVESAAARSGP